MDMLRGGVQVIARDKPLLALSIYHRLSDYYEIPLLLKSLVPKYKFKIRHHSMFFCDTVLYAYI